MACKSGRFRKRFGYFLGLDISNRDDKVRQFIAVSNKIKNVSRCIGVVNTIRYTIDTSDIIK